MSGYTLTDQNTCVLSSCPDGRFLSPYGGGCISCPTKCSTCNPDSTCINCANGYTKTNNDCLPNSNNNPVTLTLQSAYKLGNTVVITLKPSVLPPNLPADKASDIVIPVPVLTIQPSTIAVANGVIVITISYSSQIPSTQLTFLLNSNAVGDLYSQMGYSSANVYVNVSISPNMPNSPIMATTFSTRNRYELIGGNWLWFILLYLYYLYYSYVILFIFIYNIQYAIYNIQYTIYKYKSVLKLLSLSKIMIFLYLS